METILIIVIVAAAILWACRSFYRTLTGKSGCSCSKSSCSSKDSCAKLSEDDVKK